jgi:glycosyltransferase involved in cell wall biosynthesis
MAPDSLPDASPARPLSILQILEPSGGGSGRHFVDLCGALAARGHRVTAIYSPRRAEQRFVDELAALPLEAVHPVDMRRSPSPADFGAWRAIRAVIRAKGPFDVVHAHSSKAGALARLRWPGGRPAVIYTPHAFRTMDPTIGKASRLLYGLIEGLFGRLLSDAVICVSDDERRHAEETLHIPARRLETVINGVSTPPWGDRAAVRARLGLKPDSFAFGFVGRLSHQKAPERLVEAFRRISPQRPSAELAMIGAGELEADVKLRILEGHLSGRVHLGAEVPGAAAMQAFDALVMPSRYEAMSYVMLEAAAAGLPMVLSDVGGASTVVEHGVNGLIVPNDDDVAELTEAMLSASSDERLPALRTAAALRTNRFTLDRMASETEAVYIRRLEGRS